MQGWTTNASGDRDFVALKYSADSQSSGNKNPIWSMTQTSGTSGQQTAIGVAYKMIQDSGLNYLNYFSTGTTNDGTSLEDWLAIRFKELCEP